MVTHLLAGYEVEEEVPGNRRGTSLMAGRPVPRLEDRGVVECTEGDAMGLR